MARWLKRIGWGLAGCAAVFAFASWWAVRQTRYVPDFYLRAANESPADAEAARGRLRADVEKLKADAAEHGAWSAAFSDEEINAWLAEEVPKTLPRLLHSGGREPRILIEDGKVFAAARYQKDKMDTVISCEVEVELTEQPNVLAIRISKLRAGALPIPLEQFQKRITQELAKGEIDVQWDRTDSGPVALLKIPSERPEYVRTPVVVESVQLHNGHLVLAGNTGEHARQSFDPQGPVHRFVSYRQGDNRNRQAARARSSSESAKHLR